MPIPTGRHFVVGVDKNGYPFYMDETVEILDLMSVSGGQRGLQMLLSGPDLIRVTQAHLAPLCN